MYYKVLLLWKIASLKSSLRNPFVLSSTFSLKVFTVMCLTFVEIVPLYYFFPYFVYHFFPSLLSTFFYALGTDPALKTSECVKTFFCKHSISLKIILVILNQLYTIHQPIGFYIFHAIHFFATFYCNELLRSIKSRDLCWIYSLTLNFFISKLRIKSLLTNCHDLKEASLAYLWSKPILVLI